VAYQILNPGMHHWFSRAGDAVVGYAPFAGTRVVAGAPVCAPERLSVVAAELEDDAAASGERVVFFGAGARLEQVYARRADHSLLVLGQMPSWDPSCWPEIVAGKASLRAQLHRAVNKGVRVREWECGREDVAPLRRVLASWLASRGLPPLHFLTDARLLDSLGDRRVFVAEAGTGAARAVVAFLVATPVPARHGWLVEQWPRSPSAPNGTTHLLVDAAMRALAAAGARYVTLGLAPLASRGAPIGDGHRAWLRATLRWLRAHGRRFYNFAGLEAFKASLAPTAWEPVYAIAPGRRFTLRSLRAVAGAFSGGSPEWMLVCALAHALRQEMRGLGR